MFSKFQGKEDRDTRKISQKHDTKEERSALRQELREYCRQGVSLCLDGEPSTPDRIARACRVKEGGSYMRDYVSDEEGAIQQIRFDFVKD